MKSNLAITKSRGAILWALLSATFGAGCDLAPLEPAPDMGADDGGMMGDPALDPKSIFEQKALPALQAGCEVCHKTTQMGYKPFLTAGQEYDSITQYEMGRFLTSDPAKSTLLQKGPHEGPALESLPNFPRAPDDVLAWLQVEAASRGGGMSSPATPSVPLRLGDFFISLEKLVKDPLAKLTFRVEAVDRAAQFLNVTNIRVTAGPMTGIKLRYPVFLIFTLNGATKDKGDSLSTIDARMDPDKFLDMGSAILTKVPQGARIAMAFELIQQDMTVPGKMATCKALDFFNANVRPQLQGCALQCHSQGKNNSAYGAFDMGPSMSSDPATQSLFCLQSRARVDLQSPATSVLVLQPTPPGPPGNGTPNHPFKINNDPARLMAFTKAILDWAAKEK